MTDGITTGYEHAVFALGYLVGWSPILIGLVGIALMLSTVDIPHRARVHRLRRQARRSGRAVDPYAANRNPDGSYTFPIV